MASINPKLAAEAAAHKAARVRQKVSPPHTPPIDPRAPELLPMADITAMREKYQRGGGINGPGLYFLWDRDDLIYIGLSVRVSARLWSHFMKRVDDPAVAMWFDHFAFLPMEVRWLGYVERRYIRRERPPCNIRDNDD